MTGVQPLPEITANLKSINLNYGLTAYIARYGRMCMVYINGSVNQEVPEWSILGRGLPNPINSVIAPNCALMGTLNAYLNLTTDGILQTNVKLPQGWYVQATITYITIK